ncbi:hypothetical protein [Haloarchaeobius sp. DFWS5]
MTTSKRPLTTRETVFHSRSIQRGVAFVWLVVLFTTVVLGLAV